MFGSHERANYQSVNEVLERLGLLKYAKACYKNADTLVAVVVFWAERTHGKSQSEVVRDFEGSTGTCSLVGGASDF